MEKQKYLYKNSKCGSGTSSTVSLINAWISITGQRNIQKYRSIAYLGGFTIIAFATIWFLSQSPTYTIEYDPKDKDKYGKSNKSGKSDKPNKSNKSHKYNKKEDDMGKLDKRGNNTNKSSVGWWSSFREKISNKLGFGKKSKSSKVAPSSSWSNNLNSPNKTGKSNVKKRISKDNGPCSSALSSKSSNVTPNGLSGSSGSSNIRNNFHDAKFLHMSKKVQGPRCGRSSNNSNVNLRQNKTTQENLVGSYDENSSPSRNKCQQKNQVTQKIRVKSYGDNSSANSNNLHQKDQIIQQIRTESCDGRLNEVRQQQLRKLRLEAQDARSPYWTNQENKYKLGDCPISKHSEEVNSTSYIHNVEYFTKPICQGTDNNRSLTDLETRITDTIKKINFIDLQDREKYQEFYIPYMPLTLHETFDKIGQERIERYKKLLIKLARQKQEDSNLESTLEMVKEFFHEKKYYESEDDEDYHEKQVDHSDELNDFLDYIQNETATKVTGNDDFDYNKCSKFADILAQDEQASRKRIERSFEILKMINSYQQQGKETEESIKKLIEMFNKQRAKCKGATRHLRRPSRFHDEINRFEDQLMDIKRQSTDLTEGLDDMEACFAKTLELFNDDIKLDNAAAKYCPILVDDD